VRRDVGADTFLECDRPGALRCLAGTLAAALLDRVEAVKAQLPTLAGNLAGPSERDGVDRAQAGVAIATADYLVSKDP